jgi:hypothetical protein
MEPGSLGGSSFHGGHVNLPGVDGIMLRGDNGMHIDDHNSRNEDDYHRPWNMKDFALVQTVGMSPSSAPTPKPEKLRGNNVDFFFLGTGTFGRVFLARFSAARPNRPEFFALKVHSPQLIRVGLIEIRSYLKRNVYDYDKWNM